MGAARDLADLPRSQNFGNHGGSARNSVEPLSLVEVKRFDKYDR
jgi:hypothetical protein